MAERLGGALGGGAAERLLAPLPGALAEHLALVAFALAFALALGVPLGVLAERRPRLRLAVVGAANVVQTVPSLALFGLLLPLPWVGGVGARSAVVALMLYALLPVVRGTLAGLESVDPGVREAALALGMTGRQRLVRVELPLALPVLLSGARVAAVTCVGVATVAAAVGAGGLGALIFRGLRSNDDALLVAGALPAALLALAFDLGFGALARALDPRRRRPGPPRARRRLALALGAAGLAAAALGLLAPAARRGGAPAIAVGAKDFTEQVLLGELIAQLLEAEGAPVRRVFELGGNLCHEALVAGQIDVYPEYTGTALTAILGRPPGRDPIEVRATVAREYAARFGARVSGSLGFGNDFAILVRGDDARRLGLTTISQAAPFAAGWRAGFGQDFVSRPDGYEGFVRAYGLRFGAPPREMDLSLTYRALAAGEVDLIAGNSTDGRIKALDLAQLVDDRAFFPPYEAVLVAREGSLARSPALARVVARLEGAISVDEMRGLNGEVDGRKRAPAEVVRELRRRKGW
ncbi:MAG TPA: ABC transporter permease/substrate-binding protein [Polyangiaceae bacterium]|nr:ABC transporter permease/substrate-binding protein [Polyangiaceae bacterium]